MPTQANFNALLQDVDFREAVKKVIQLTEQHMRESITLIIDGPGPAAPSKHIVAEIIGGNLDGSIFDSSSTDPTERSVARILGGSNEFEVAARVEADNGEWVQLRPRRG